MKRNLLLLFLLVFAAGNSQVTVVQPGDLVTCSNNDFAVFNLTTQTPVILGNLSPNDYTITYHTSSAAANSATAAIPNPTAYTNFSSPQVIWARVQQNSAPANYGIAEFHLRVNLTPMIADQSFVMCDFVGSPDDGITAFNLGAIAEQLWAQAQVSPTQLQIAFFETQADAVANVNPLSNPYYNMFANQVIYVRSTYYESGCSTISTVTLITENCGVACPTPTNLVVTNITSNGATFGWTSSGNVMQWEVLVVYSDGPFPLPTMNGIVVSTNPVTLTGLECPESYDVYVRSKCGEANSDWSQSTFFHLQNCQGSGFGQPQNLTACANNGTACFDLTVNDANVLAGLNPDAFAVTYYTTHSNAETATAEIENPSEYCVSGIHEIYIRVQDLTTGDFVVLAFVITPQGTILDNDTLSPMVACDEDLNGTVVFNLTTAGSSLNTTNALAYYSTLTHAQQENDPIANPGAFTVQTTNVVSLVYIRETVEGGCDIIYSLQLNALVNCNLSNVCAGANSLCNSLGVPFNNTTGLASAETGNNYGCLFSTPNPTWFYLPVSGNGTINLMIQQSTSIGIEQPNLDVDYIVYGPFGSPVEPCSGLLTEDKIVSCSFSSQNVEYPTIPNAQAGQFYIIMTTNYSNQPGYIKITETGQSQGEIDCTGLRLTAFLDSNSNGVKDAGESNFTLGQFNFERNNDSVVHHITSPTGVHRIYDINATNTYDLSYTVDSAYSAYYNVSATAFVNVSVVAGAGLQDYSFPITATSPYNDVEIVIIPDQAPRPGFLYTNTIQYTNVGSQTVASGQVIFHHDPAVSIASVSQAGTTPVSNGFSFSYTNLAPFETRSITVVMQVPTIPGVQLGELLENHAEISPFAGDATPENNDSHSNQVVIGSYDPNDITESHGNQILFSSFTSADYLYYTIRFENSGTASAININVIDELDPQLNAESVRMVSASHNYILDRVGNQLSWRFENVLLPPAVAGSDDGHGYITFKVKPAPGYAVGDIIPNSANIYFDFNPAIVTNVFNTEFVSALAVNEFTNSGFTVYPNPANTMLNITMRNDDTIRSVKLLDISGKIIISRSGSPISTEAVDVSEVAAGVYFVEVIGSSNTRAIKKVIIQ